MRILIGADHAGYVLKTTVIEHLARSPHDVTDCGTHDTSPVDYPDIARMVGDRLIAGDGDRAITICGSGVGASVAANKIKGVRAAICHDTYSAHQGVEHDDMNMLVLGSRVIGTELAIELVDAFLGAVFSGEERHVRRLNKVIALERAIR